MRRVYGVLLLLVMPGGLMAAPEPPPPTDYPGTQYIDRTGCVFVREKESWVARFDGQGMPICGFPPSQPAEPLTAAPPSPEAVLTDILAEGLRRGDLARDPAPQTLAEVPEDPEQAALNTELAEQVGLEARMRSTLSGQAPGGLCARLGYRPDSRASALIGEDVTQGLCPGMTVDAPGQVIAAAVVRSAAKTVPTPQTSKPVAAGKAAGKPAAAPAPKVSPDKPRSVVARRTTAPSAPKALIAEMIPASARYVQIGTYQDEGNALGAVRRLAALGYPAAQRREQANGTVRQVILAGPFSNRQAIVAALTRLRANGYPRATAR